MIFVGKGPSAEHAAAAIAASGDAVATVNDAGLVFSGEIDFAFFVDVEMLERACLLWPRMKTIVLPSRLHQHCRRSRLTPQDVPLLPHGRVVIYQYHHTGRSEHDLLAAIEASHVPLYCTAVAGLFWLARQGHREIRCYGFDGGGHYASAFGDPVDTRGRTDRFRQGMETMAGIVGTRYGTKVRFYPDVD